MKKCIRCGELKELSEFYCDKARSDGHQSDCKKCNYTKCNSYRKQNLTRYREIRKKYRQTLKGRFDKWRSGAKHRGITFKLTLKDIQEIPMICYYTGETLAFKPNEWNTASLDRIDSTKGYTKENVVLCCSDINFMKQKMTYEQFIRTCRKIVNHFDK